MWKHFFRQLLNLPVGGPYGHVRIRFVGHGAFRITTTGRSARVVIHTTNEQGKRVSQVRRATLERWDDGSTIEESTKEQLLAATLYWLRTQGNFGEIVP